MGNKFRPGLPADFQLNVTPISDLGDYLDERGPAPRLRTIPPTARPPVPSGVVTVARPNAAEPLPDKPASRRDKPGQPRESGREIAAVGTIRSDTADQPPTRPKAPRREVSMTPEALRMSEELLALVRSGSGQRDTKANELVHALLLLVYEVKGELDVHALPKRGRWGTPTARTYPVELKNAFRRALARKTDDIQGR